MQKWWSKKRLQHSRHIDAGVQWARRLALAGLIGAAAVFAATPSAGRAEEPATDYAGVIERLKTAVQYEVRSKALPAFSISLVDDTRLVWAEGFGFQDAEKKRPATANTVYRVGSVSKLFTDIAVMQLAEQGKLDLDLPVQRYLPTFAPKNESGVPITLRQLMSHRAGLVRESPVGHYFDPDEPTLQATVESLNETVLVYKPETRTKYSNAGVSVVGAVLAKQTGEDFAKRIESSILKPLQMKQSSFEMTPELKENLATAWMWTYDGRRFEAPTFALGTAPAGNLYSTALDLSKFLVCLFEQGSTPTGKLLKRNTLTQMLTATTDRGGRPLEFGIGFHIQQLDGHKMIGHGGAVYGFSTQFEALPERKLGVAAIAAIDGSNGVVRRLTDYALRLMLAKQDGKPLPKYATTTAIPPKRVASMVGVYRNRNRFTTISEFGGRVFMQRGVVRSELRAASRDGSIISDDVSGFGNKVRLSSNRLTVGGTTYTRLPDKPPSDAPRRWMGLIGEYGWDHNTLYILEDQGQLIALIEWFYAYPLKELSQNEFAFPDYGLYFGEKLRFSRDGQGKASQVAAAEVVFRRREVGTRDGETFRIKPVRPIDDLRPAAMSANPPVEEGEFRDADLVELTSLDSTIKLDIRYASTNNFTGAVFYEQSRAFMQRPAAEAVVRVHRRLKRHGFGLLIHDAYRPWHVTKMFWDATPSNMKDFVANPANGSRHNRGCAVDLTLYDLASGRPIQMVAGYDEFSSRSFPLYPGGTSRQRWHREFLRQSMRAEGFTVYKYEWWHFDFKDWKKYRIGNQTFKEILKAE